MNKKKIEKKKKLLPLSRLSLPLAVVRLLFGFSFSLFSLSLHSPFLLEINIHQRN